MKQFESRKMTGIDFKLLKNYFKVITNLKSKGYINRLISQSFKFCLTESLKNIYLDNFFEFSSRFLCFSTNIL